MQFEYLDLAITQASRGGLCAGFGFAYTSLNRLKNLKTPWTTSKYLEIPKIYT